MNTFWLSVCCMLQKCPHLCLSFLADSNSWNVNGTLNLRTLRQMLKVMSQTASDKVLHILYQLG